jgi:ketosteroid isomerase-like protein
MSEENVELVMKLFDAVGRGDIDAAMRYVRADGEWVNPDNAMEPGTRSGLSGVRTALTALRDSFDDLRFQIDQMLDLGNRVLVTGTFSGVGRASGAGFGPQPFGSLVTVSDGKVQRYQWYLDPDEARAASGLSE